MWWGRARRDSAVRAHEPCTRHVKAIITKTTTRTWWSVGRPRRLLKYDGRGDACRPPPLPPRQQPRAVYPHGCYYFLFINNIVRPASRARAHGVRGRREEITMTHTYRLRNGHESVHAWVSMHSNAAWRRVMTQWSRSARTKGVSESPFNYHRRGDFCDVRNRITRRRFKKKKYLKLSTFRLKIRSRTTRLIFGRCEKAPTGQDGRDRELATT